MAGTAVETITTELDVDHAGIRYVDFIHPQRRGSSRQDRPAEFYREVTLRREEWENMGCPQIISVTITPGGIHGS